MPTLDSNMAIEGPPASEVGVGVPTAAPATDQFGTLLMLPTMVGLAKPRFIKVKGPPFGAPTSAPEPPAEEEGEEEAEG